VSDEQEDWQYNYFNYFTEAEEHFQRARGTGLFLLSPLDWALIEGWKNAGVPLEAVLRGIDEAFVRWRGKKSKTRMVNSLAYCAQEVLSQAQVMAGADPRRAARPAAAPFELEDLRAYLMKNAEQLRRTGEAAYGEIAGALERLATEAETHYQDLEDLERRLTALEDKMVAVARTRQNEEELLEARRELDLQLRPHRGKMTADQLAILERQYLQRRLLEAARLPRLSLFYMH
jgi:hypothetical protein